MKRLFQTLPLPPRASVGLLVLRLVAGLAFMHHGWGKIQNPFAWAGPDSAYPAFLLGLAALSEFGGGLAWILGLLTPLASFGIACTMAVATYLHAVVMKDPFVPSGPGGSYELALLFLCLAVLFSLAGPGRYSLDRKIFGERG
jgi:putative oxidoreductase